MSYEADCLAYAAHGNPERDHYDHEEGARFDRFDGLRGDMYDYCDEDDFAPVTLETAECDYLNTLTDEANGETLLHRCWSEAANPVPF